MTKNEIENPVYDTRNIRITRICVVILLIICAVMLVRGPWLTAAFVRGLHGRDFLLSDKPYAFGVTITIGYICGTLALVMLIMMFRFLGRLAQGMFLQGRTCRRSIGSAFAASLRQEHALSWVF